MGWTDTTKKSSGNRRATTTLAGIGDILGSLGKQESKFYELEVGEVLDICLNSEHEAFEALGGYSNGAIGRVKIRLLHSKPISSTIDYSGGKLGKEIWARPLFSNTKSYPLMREYVVVGDFKALICERWNTTAAEPEAQESTICSTPFS